MLNQSPVPRNFSHFKIHAFKTVTGIYLDCLYLTEETKGQGIGYNLMNKLKTFSLENNINTIQW
jgi:GNAT superfamily N-acetyltransferase